MRYASDLYRENSHDGAAEHAPQNPIGPRDARRSDPGENTRNLHSADIVDFAFSTYFLRILCIVRETATTSIR
jgi:hypothetical protein